MLGSQKSETRHQLREGEFSRSEFCVSDLLFSVEWLHLALGL
jgi:hypothetical protein